MLLLVAVRYIHAFLRDFFYIRYQVIDAVNETRDISLSILESRFPLILPRRTVR